MEERVSIVRQEYSALKIYRNPENGRFQQMSIAVSDDVASKIEIIQNDTAKTYEIRQKFIDAILNETNCCQGYFFDPEPNMNYRYLYLEHCLGNLDTYIGEKPSRSDFNWTVLPELCSQLVDSVAWLHHRNLFHDGNLNPRNILVKISDHNQTRLKLLVPDSLNPFNKLDIVYAKSWSIVVQQHPFNLEETSIRKDISSVAMLVYFIQSAGSHPFQLDSKFRQDFTAIQDHIQSELWDVKALNKKCFCEQVGCNEVACKYRSWVNSLAQDWVENILMEVYKKPIQSFTKTSSDTLLEHPFFWKVTRILYFLEKSANYLNGVDNEGKKEKFGYKITMPNSQITWLKKTGGRKGKRSELIKSPEWVTDMGYLKKNYKSIISFLHETPDQENNQMKDIKNFFWLLRQIRNKSCHWNEENSEFGNEARRELESIRFLMHHHNQDQMDVYPTKYCLFWMVHFPTLLLYTWKELKCNVIL